MNQRADAGVEGGPSDDDIFLSLVASAFEFLEEAIAGFDRSTKFSTVNFAVAIELILKARLLKHGWELLISDPRRIDRSAFVNGLAHTVTPEQAMDRLASSGAEIPTHARQVFKTIFSHRNRMVHFVHVAADNPAPEDASKVRVAREQLAGWVELGNLLLGWREFVEFRGQIAHIAFLMERQKEFLSEVFRSKAGVIAAQVEAGLRVGSCPLCKHRSVLVAEPIGAIEPATCAVCSYHGAEITIRCEQEGCEDFVVFRSYDSYPLRFPHCQTRITDEFVRGQLDTQPPLTKRNYFDRVDTMHCPECAGYDTVVEHETIFVCTNCFDIAEEVGVCGYCGQAQLGEIPAYSNLTGCDFCEGQVGDDD